MAIVWIVTTGNSDIQLTSIPDKWLDLCKEKKSDLKPCLDEFRSKEGISKQKTGLYTVVARLLGVIFSDKIDEYRNYFKFYLLDGFCKTINEKSIKPDRIIVLLTDQEAIFDISDRGDCDSPYWKDTCALEPILSRYLGEKFESVEISFVFLNPKKDKKGLDNWNDTLILLQNRLQQKFDELGITSDDEVIVSHQAGTPAISSALQLTSLILFGGQVKFLVGSELDHNETEFLNGSDYFKMLQIKELLDLLKRHDYSGITGVVKIIGFENSDNKTKLDSLLNASVQWNLAEFEKFQNLLSNLYKQGEVTWWSIGYESAYLAVIRHLQGNIIEALFHSFRAIEGLICKWAEEKYKEHISYDKNGSPQVQESIKTVLPNYWEKMEQKNSGWLKQQEEANINRKNKGKAAEPYSVGLFSQNLYILLEEVRPDCKKDEYMKKGLYSAKDARNQQFHRLLALQEEDLLKAWKVSSISEWQNTILGCLNFIAGEDLPKAFESLEDASLMSQVHKGLEVVIREIASY